MMTVNRTEKAQDNQNLGTAILEQMGGTRGIAYTALPIVVFVLANSIGGLIPAIVIAVGVAVAITVLRIVRKERVQPAISGLIGVGTASFVAYQTGSAKGFFLIGIWASLLFGAICLISVLVRRPLVGVVTNLLNGTGSAWRGDRPSLFAYDIATMSLVAVFAARFVVQQWLYTEDATGWLAFARLAMGYPLLALAGLVILWAVRRSTKRLSGLSPARPA